MNARATSSYKFGPFHLDASERVLWREGKPVSLTRKAFEILLALVERSGHLVEKEELMKVVWGDTFVEEANLSQNIFHLRRILGKTAEGEQYIETVPRHGFRFIAPVTESGDDPSAPVAQPFPAQHSINRNARKGKAINSLAVLPLINESSDHTAEYLSDGITESIINSLSQLPKLRVMAHGAVLRYKGREVDPQQAGRELGVRTVLTGRLLQLGDRLIIRTELVDVAEGWQLWGEQYDRHPSDILDVQEEIARTISGNLRLKLTNEERKRITKRYTENTEAYHLYMRGRYFWNKYNAKGLVKSVEYFQKAIATDPGFALAYAGLADSYHRLSNLRLSPREAMPKAKAAAIKAVECDDNLAEAHLSLGLVKLYYDYDWAGAEKEYTRALELNPGASLAHLRYAAYLTYSKRFEEGHAEIKQALELDPLSIQINLILGTNLHLMGRHEEAITQYQKTLELNQNYYPVHFSLGLVYLHQKQYAEAISKLQHVCSLSDDAYLPSAYLGHTYAVSGRRADAIKVLKRLKEKSKKDYVSPYGVAVIYAGLGDRDQAFEWLEKAYDEHNDWMIYLNVAHAFDELRSDSRFSELLRRVGFVD